MAEGWNDTALNLGVTAIQSAAAYAQLYTAEPNAAGTTNASSAGRQAVTWDTASGGDFAITTDIAFTGGEASGSCTHIGFWSASSGGTFYGYWAIDSGDVAFNSEGEYTLQSGSIPGASS